MKRIFIRLGGLSLALLFGVAAAVGGATLEREPDLPPSLQLVPKNGERSIVFGERLPASVTEEIVIGKDFDVEIFGQDCCIRDDVVQIFIHDVANPERKPCLLGEIDSRGGPDGTHQGEIHTVSLPEGHYKIEYRMIESGPGRSGWKVRETFEPFTNRFSCRCPQFHDKAQTETVSFDKSENACGETTLGPRFPKWGRFGNSFGLSFDSGDELEIFCEDLEEGSVPVLLMAYKPPEEQIFRTVGMCPFERGRNLIQFSHLGDFDRNGHPDCLIGTGWRSRDYGENDDPNPWTKERGEELLDWALTTFDASTKVLSAFSYQFEYTREPPVFLKDGVAEGTRVNARLLFSRRIFDKSLLGEEKLLASRQSWVDPLRTDPVLGSETEELFDEVLALMAELPPGDPAVLEEGRLCDVNDDGRCDEADFELFTGALGACFEEERFHPAVDADGDGCIEEPDGEQLFGLIIDVKPGSDTNSVNPRSRGVIPVAVLATGFSANPLDLDPASLTFGATGTEAPPDHFAYEDVDGDGDLDLILHFRTQQTGLGCEDTTALLAGHTVGGEALASFDTVRTVGCR